MQYAWTRKEQAIAKKAFKIAKQRLDQQLRERISVAHTTSIEQMWALFNEINIIKKDMEKLLSSDYSQYDQIFPILIYQDLLALSELDGLSPRRLEHYRKTIPPK